MTVSPESIRFAADIMVGRLARWLRVLGYDTLYNVHLSAVELVARAQNDRRVLLTRSPRLIEENPGVEAFLLRPDRPHDQLTLVMKTYDLGTEWIFTRCIRCNVVVDPVSAGEIQEKVPADVLQVSQRFFRCPRCRKVYWEGSHLKRFREFLERVV